MADSPPQQKRNPNRPDPQLVAPYIESGQITQGEIDHFSQAFVRSGNYSFGGSIIGSFMLLPYSRYWRPKAKFIERLAVGVGSSIIGGAIGSAIAMSVIAGEVGTNPEARRKLALFQDLIFYTNAPASIRRGLRLPPTNPADPASVPSFPPPSSSIGFPSSAQPESIGTQATKSNPWAGKQFPIPASSKHYDSGVLGGDEEGQGLRDSQGRLFPGQAGRRIGEDLNGDVGGDSGRAEMNRERERERGIVGGGRMSAGSSEGALDQATLDNPTSWSLLRSRSTATLPGTSTSSLPSGTTAPFSSDYSSTLPASSASSPSAPSSSSRSGILGGGRMGMERGSGDGGMTEAEREREREQAEFDRLLERERTATDDGMAAPVGGGGAGGSAWDRLRGGGGRGNAKKAGEEVW